MKKIRVSEIFTSFQGEGVFTGMPSLWVRFFGCNLQCNGFGQDNPADPATYDLPYEQIDVSKYKSMSDLPVFGKGCDSSYSWSAKFKCLAKDYTVEELTNELVRMGMLDLDLYFGLPAGNLRPWMNAKTLMPSQLCFTGGEPMLYQNPISDICQEFYYRRITPLQITVETNGTIPIDEYGGLRLTNHLHLSCSPKLFTVSGESDAVNIHILKQYVEFADSGAFKFVHNGSKDAWDELDGYAASLRSLIKGNSWRIYVMPVGSTLESQDPSFLSGVALEAMKRGYWVCPRSHIQIFGNQIGT